MAASVWKVPRHTVLEVSPFINSTLNSLTAAKRGAPVFLKALTRISLMRWRPPARSTSADGLRPALLIASPMSPVVHEVPSVSSISASAESNPSFVASAVAPFTNDARFGRSAADASVVPPDATRSVVVIAPYLGA